MGFLGWRSKPVGKVEPEDEVCLDLQKTFAKFHNQSYLQNQGERKEGRGKEHETGGNAVPGL